MIQTCSAQTDLKKAKTALDVRFWGCIAAVKAAQKLIRPGGSITMTSGTIALKPIKDWAIATGVLRQIQAQGYGDASSRYVTRRSLPGEGFKALVKYLLRFFVVGLCFAIDCWISWIWPVLGIFQGPIDFVVLE